VLRRTRRSAAVLSAAALLLVPALAACGDSSDSSTESKASDTASSSTSASASDDASSPASAPPTGELDQVSFTGDVGKELKAEWHSAIDKPDSTTVTTLVPGDGEQVADGDTVSTYLYVGNGTTQKDIYSDYDNGAPESIPYSAQLGEVFNQLLTGATYGSRVAAVTTAEALFGADAADSNQLGVSGDDAVVVVADIVEKAAVAPEPTDDQAHDADPSTQPKVVEKDGKPTGLDFSGIEEPALDTPVQRVVLKEGDGPEVTASDTVTVDYLGAVYDADQPFDESYSKGQPLTSALSGLIQGWTIGLTGVKVGSRVLLQIPPAYGYGAQGSGDSIPGNATLWFVIDVTKAE
jgi:peptidylprolyl isomerase